MQYTKPTLVLHGAALTCVQSVNKPAPYVLDIDLNQTATAYESDE